MKKHPWFTTFIILGLAILLFSLAGSSNFKPSTNLSSIPRVLSKMLSFNFNQQVEAQAPQTVYVAATVEDCGDFSPCYTNTNGVDGSNGQGTGLRDAVLDLNDGDEIIILKNYPIKDQTVLIDKNLTIRGYQNASITYLGSNCGLPMLNFTSGGTIKDLTITDGSCTTPSRDLITAGSQQDLHIEHNTLQGGNRAVNIKSNDGNITVAFNQITNNLEYAIYHGKGAGTGLLNIYANNIHNNRAGAQVNCNDSGQADHNYWGDGILATAAVEFCQVSDAKRLGAPILVLTDSPGVQALRQRVTESTAYAFDNNISMRRSSGSDYDLIVVNHGQGSEKNIPFLNDGATPIVACSNFYDVFLAEDALASELVLALKYDLNNTCIARVESSDFCGGNDDSKYPLWWYDPASNLTDGWDRTGQIPQGVNPLVLEGQTTTCNMSQNEIQVVIDSSGRPGITDDLSFTPFIAGLPVGSSNILTFTGKLNTDEVKISWETGQEVNISGYHVLRSGSEDGPFFRISQFIPTLGAYSLYEFTDSLDSSEFDLNYYYKIEIINIYGDTLRSHGPISILTSTPTPTLTQTRTPTPTRTMYPTRTPFPTSTPGPTRTATRYIFRSPTSIYRPRTSTPVSSPTQVRTDRPTPTIDQTLTAEQTFTLEVTIMTATTVPSSTAETAVQVPSWTPNTEDDMDNGEVDDQPAPDADQTYWEYLLLGAGSGMGILVAAGYILTKGYLNL